MFSRLLTALVILIGLSPPVAADALNEARQDYIDGNYQAALAVLEPMARSGNATAQNIMGAAYEAGHGVGPDPEKARAWYEQAAAQGLAKADYNLGLLHKKAGRYDGAVMAFEAAMALDYGAAFYERGKMLRYGIGGPVLSAQAAAAFERGLNLGNAPAGVELAEMHRLGEGMPQDAAKARGLYQAAAISGNAVALGNLALMYETGLGGVQDHAAAYALYQQAVARGDENAVKNLAAFRQNTKDTAGYWLD